MEIDKEELKLLKEIIYKTFEVINECKKIADKNSINMNQIFNNITNIGIS